MGDEFFASEQALNNIMNIAGGVRQGIKTVEQGRAIMGGNGGGGMEEKESVTQQVRQLGGLRFLENAERIREAKDAVVTLLPKRADSRNETGSKARAALDTLTAIGDLNENDRLLSEGMGRIEGGQGNIVREIQRLRSSVMGQGQIDPNIGIEAGMSMLTDLLAGGAAAGLSLATGIPGDAASAIVDEMQRYGVDSGMIDRIKSQIDTNKDGAVSEFETKSLLNDTAMIEKLSSMDATTRKMLRDPDFRVRVIQRKPVTSIYGEDPFARFNQVEMVEQGIANDGANANQFNVSF
jgi:hypothetical protein